MTGNAPRKTASLRGATSRRDILGATALGAAVALTGFDWPARGPRPAWHGTDVSHNLPTLRFTMQDASTGRTLDADDVRGQVVLLTFGYSSCPDACPLTLANLAAVLRALGTGAEQVRALFVTVDPARDTLPVLRDYVAQFATRIVGLRGDADALASLARRYRVAYSVTRESGTEDSGTQASGAQDSGAQDSGGQSYEVTHSSLIYAFDRDGAARLIFGSLATGTPDLAGMEADLRRLIAAPRDEGVWARLAPWA